MRIYEYDQNTREFLREGEADPNPLEPGNWLIPAYATEQKPPEQKDGFARCFFGEWEYVEDHRGEAYRTADGLLVDYPELGPLPKDLTKTPRPDVDHDWNAKTRAWKLNAQRRRERLELEAKIKRDALLAQSDWTQLADVSLSKEKRSAWTDYRQALRDITKQPGFPETIDWPTKP